MSEKIPDITRDERLILASLKRRPALYISAPRLTDFVNWYMGYKAALLMADLYSERVLLPDGLHDYAAMKYLGHTRTSKGWFSLILEKEPDEKKAFDMFWELLDEYLVSLGYEPIPRWEDVEDEWNKRRNRKNITNNKGENYHA